MRLDEILLKGLIQWFLSYVSGFTSQEPEKNRMFKTKIEHTMIVCHEIGQLGQEMHLDQDGIILARIMDSFMMSAASSRCGALAPSRIEFPWTMANLANG